MEEAARSCATVVVLMGTRKIAEIAALFSLHRPGETPIALLQSGSLPDNKATIGTINDVAEIVAAAQSGARGILVVGEVVKALARRADIVKAGEFLETCCVSSTF